MAGRYARLVGMSESGWKRHANPWSVWTRFAAIPLLILAIWSRTWFGWWALVPLAVVVLWLWWNPHAFEPIEEPVAWSSKGIYGEWVWVQDGSSVPPGFKVPQRLWTAGGLTGFALLVWGLTALEVWPTVVGAAFVVQGQLWRIDRLGLLYEQAAAQRGHSAAPAGAVVTDQT